MSKILLTIGLSFVLIIYKTRHFKAIFEVPFLFNVKIYVFEATMKSSEFQKLSALGAILESSSFCAATLASMALDEMRIRR